MASDLHLEMNEYLPLRDVVFNTLRQAILRGELKPGERLMEIALSQRLGVSRTPVREAIRMLEQEGLVIMIPRKGAQVAEISEKDLKDVLDACRYYFEQTGRRITFEYSLVAGVNDSDEDARELSGRIRDMNCHVNLIPVNPIKERSFVRSTRQAVENFKIKLEKCGINVTIRREMGSDIDGACGQLRKSYMEKTESEK